MPDFDDLGDQFVQVLGVGAAHELLWALTRTEADRAALIGRLSVRGDAVWLADLLTDLEVDEPARLQVAETLRHRLFPPQRS